MKFALVNNAKTEAFKGGRGTCRRCRGDVLGKCGEFRIHHWAHKKRENCLVKPGEETAWHRGWKDKYPVDWQEWMERDQASGEKHFADVRTEHGLVLEFQYSPIDPTERRSREEFHGNMAWVVNGARLKYDYPRFLKHLNFILNEVDGRWHYLYNPNAAFPKGWRNSNALVFFDFLGDANPSSSESNRQPLWCLFPGRVRGFGLVAKVLRHEFHKMSTERRWLFQKPPEDVLKDKAALIGDYRKGKDFRAIEALQARSWRQAAA